MAAFKTLREATYCAVLLGFTMLLTTVIAQPTVMG